MAIVAGVRLGPYEILSQLGAGGMGEVYRARDTRLDRVVAIKVLAPDFADSDERRRRFEREARAISSLNHPHIAALHDVGQHDGIDFLVMECVEGQTLSDRLEKGALPVREALGYAVQTADALDNAHRQGIVHRDLKPSNIMLTKSGVKVLDFGLAKRDGRVTDSDLTTSAKTKTRDVTEEGVIVGTLQYMAPEQLEGKDVDVRADLFAFGGILYEMLAGRPAFEGKSQASLIAAILEHDPAPIAELAPNISPVVVHTIRRCLEKDPDERWQSALDLGKELLWASEPVPEKAPPYEAAGKRPGWHVAAALAAVALALAAGLVVGNRMAASTTPEAIFVSGLPLGASRLDLRGRNVYASVVAVSPDGKHVAYVGEEDGVTRIYLRPTDRPQATRVDGSDGAYGPFFSPDSRWLAFLSIEKPGIWKVPIGGGAPVLIVEVTAARGASWGTDGAIYFTPNLAAGVFRVLESGGEAERLTTTDRDRREKTHRFPELLPNGKGVLFAVGPAEMDTFDEASIEVLTLATAERRVLVKGGTNPHYLATGHLVYARGGSLFAVPFDPEGLEVTGIPFPVLEGLMTSPQYGSAHLGVSNNGVLVFASGSPRVRKSRLVWVDRKGNRAPMPGMTRNFGEPRISPDGSRVAVQADEATLGLWVHELSRGTWTRLVSGWDNGGPIWEPDGSFVTFGSSRRGPYDLFRKAVDASLPAEPLTEDPRTRIPGSWSPDGSILVFTSGGDIWALQPEAAGAPNVLLGSLASESSPEISPDGLRIAYVSDESGREEVYVQTFPEPSRRVQVSTDGGLEPAWNATGQELFYREGGRMMAVSFRQGQPSRPRFLFDASRYRTGTRNYDVAPDGRFLMVEELDPGPLPDHLTLIVNWFDELRARLETP